MNYIINAFTFFQLLSLTLSIIGPLYDYYYVWDGQKQSCPTTVFTELRIYSNFTKSSKVIVNLYSEGEIDKNKITYGRYSSKKSYTSSFDESPTIVSLDDNTYECTYSVSEGKHDYNYGVLKIEGLSILQSVLVSVEVISDTTYWTIIIIIGVVVILLIIGIIVVCKKFYRCMCCNK